MITWKNLVCACVLSMTYLSSFAASTPEGKWAILDEQTGKKRAVIEFVLKDDTLNGTIETIYPQPGDTGICSKCPGKFKDKPIQGLQIVWGLKEKHPGEWAGGEILDAQTGKIYHVKMTLKNNKLYLRGYVGVSILGRTQIWERA